MAANNVSRQPDNSPRAFFRQLTALLNQAEQGFTVLAGANPERAALYKAALLPIGGVREQIADLRRGIAAEPEADQQFQRILSETGATPLIASALATPAPGGESGAVLANVEDGLSLGKDVLDKASKWLPPPWDNVSGNVGDVLGIVGKLAGDKSAELKKIEELEAALGEIRQELEKVEGKAERLGELTGRPVVTGDDKTLVGPPPAAGFPPSEIPGSLLWMVWQNQYKLEHLWRKTFGDDPPANQQGWVGKPPELSALSGVADTWLRENGGQIGRLAYKLDKLAELLGKAIVDSSAEWDPEPPIEITSVNPATHNKLPEKAVKEELHDLEDLLRGLRQLIIVLIDIDILDIDVDIDFIQVINNFYTAILERHPFKRIYVYDEGVFEAQGPQDRRRIAVRTPAFDLAGWIDLDDMLVGDAVRVDVYVRLPSGSGAATRRRLYRRRVFRGTGPTPGRAVRAPDGRGVKSLQDICGPSVLVGKALDIEIRQVASVGGYPSPMRIAYQFVVESNDDPLQAA